MGRGKFLSMLQKSSLGEPSDATVKSTEQTSRDKTSSDEQRGTTSQSFGDTSRPEVSK